jgi:hypothetical protein
MHWASAEALELAERTGVADPEVAIRMRAREVLSKAGIGSIPVPLPILFKAMDVRKVKPVAMLLEGALRSGPSGFDILVREDRSVRRQRFTIAHELGHLLFYRFAERTKGGQRAEGKAAPAEEERLCNVAAEEFLMPEWFVQKTFSMESDPLTCIRIIARECNVSVEAALIRSAPFVNRKGALQLWRNDREWRLRLTQRTGNARTNLDTFTERDGLGPFIGEAARVARWECHGWLRSRRPSAVVHVSTHAVTLCGRGQATVLVQHVLSRPGTCPRPGNLERFARDLLREANRTPADPRCIKCKGEGWIERHDGFARCRCRIDALARRRETRNHSRRSQTRRAP